MPSSTYKHISISLDWILKTKAKNILDCGVGYGKWGYLCREYLDVYAGRVFPDKWKTSIYGIEIFEDYINKFPWLNIIYNHIFVCDMIDKLKEFSNCEIKFDLVIACDVIEHLEKDKALECIGYIKDIGKHILVSIPLGKEWLNNKVVANNIHEKHKSSWELEELLELFPSSCYDIWKINQSRKGVVLFFTQNKGDM